ncbi:RagB/SusD family nutrient uptake outer membrane protein [Niabella sp. CC-SYL272]|uniref:RagB/SusD family nutrient uptake outer membrane protein n=1 Tax=Niabella agricola TaxID=2891571 RepID=UPI001F469A6B|nr:RagB/SusD family nutrient uptake outer membrane protein [Niabella agricola]MCF3108750.1 RagB/SusD family nutrient uptake outer membrane protein [Niabella agricola]
MNRKYYLPILCFAVIGLGSCKKFLQPKPTDFLGTDTYYKTEQQLNFALAGVYNTVGNGGFWGSYANYLLDWEADIAYMNRLTLNGPFNFNYSASDPYMTGLWTTLWDGINRANVLLENIDKNPAIPLAARDRVKGEALFLRGYYYFTLVQYWGGVPIKLTSTKSPSEVSVARAPAKEVYAQVLADITAAEPLVRNIRSLGFSGAVNKSAVRGMLARVCLTMAGEPLKDVTKYQDAKMWAKKVMDDAEAGHGLNPGYPNIFITLAQDKYDIKENLWEAEFYGNNADPATMAFSEWTNIGYINGPQSAAGSATGNGVAYMNITAKFYNAFEEGDLRKWWSIAHFTYVNSQVNGEKLMSPLPATERDKWYMFPAKWRREYEAIPRGSSVVSATNMPIIRYSDILLMFAEAENEINGGPTADAIAAVNLVRRRAWSTGVKSIAVTNGGSGYTSAPTVTIAAGNGSSAEATALVQGGVVVAVNLTRDPTGVRFFKEGSYTSAPQVSISGAVALERRQWPLFTRPQMGKCLLPHVLLKQHFSLLSRMSACGNSIWKVAGRQTCFAGESS